MCDPIESDERASGEVWRLCAEFPDHLVESALAAPPQMPVVAETLGCFKGATHAVFEHRYFDMDYRSEFSATHQTTFATRDPDTTRLHLFEGPAEKLTPRAIARECADSYLGYVVLRPQSPGAVGRSIVPPRREPQELSANESLSDHVRTIVAEGVTLFGVKLRAVGIPFMEQDGKLLRCVHVAAWMCHYTANLRGIVPRYRTADIYAAEDDRYALGRRYPSAGLTDEALNLVLGRTGLPADFLEPDDILKVRECEWYDRPAVWRLTDARGWATENLTASICRYLNSGFPVILALNDSRHATVVCGYLRNDDLATPVNKDDPSAVTHFIVNDDQKGPYRVVALHELLGQLEDDGEELSVLAPLPPGLWLSGEAAQETGAMLFQYWLRRSLESVGDWAAAWNRDPAPHDEALRKAVSLLEAHGPDADPRCGLAIRASAMTGSDFKQSYVSLTEDDDLHDIVGYASLPRYVWVIEVLDRSVRMANAKDVPAVVGTVVLDASEVVKKPEDVAAVSALFIHVPGQATVKPSANHASWVPVPADNRFSMRWNHGHSWLLDGDAVAANQKGALASP